MSDQEQLLKSLAPLMAGNRLNNLVDLLAVVADMLEMADNAMVEKLAGVFDDVVTVGWEGGTALRMAWGSRLTGKGIFRFVRCLLSSTTLIPAAASCFCCACYRLRGSV